MGEKVDKGSDSESSSSSSASSRDSDSDYSDSTEAQALRKVKQEQTALEKRSIIPELLALGVYAHSIKPKKGWLRQSKCLLV